MQDRARPRLSIVIPARNEARRLPDTLRAIERYARQRGEELEVVVADDRSTDRTPRAALSAAGSLDVRIVRVHRSQGGPGAAATAGVLAARGSRILLCDADGPVPFEDLDGLHRALDAGWKVAAGSRVLPESRVEVPQPRHRILIGRLWARVVRAVLPTTVRDTQCGFKLFERDAARELFGRARSRGFAFHVEVLALCETLGIDVIELPVRWRDKPGSRVRLGRDPAHMFAELLAAAVRLRRLRTATEIDEHDAGGRWAA